MSGSTPRRERNDAFETRLVTAEGNRKGDDSVLVDRKPLSISDGPRATSYHG